MHEPDNILEEEQEQEQEEKTRDRTLLETRYNETWTVVIPGCLGRKEKRVTYEDGKGDRQEHGDGDTIAWDHENDNYKNGASGRANVSEKLLLY